MGCNFGFSSLRIGGIIYGRHTGCNVGFQWLADGSWVWKEVVDDWAGVLNHQPTNETQSYTHMYTLTSTINSQRSMLH